MYLDLLDILDQSIMTFRTNTKHHILYRRTVVNCNAFLTHNGQLSLANLRPKASTKLQHCICMWPMDIYEHLYDGLSEKLAKPVK